MRTLLLLGLAILLSLSTAQVRLPKGIGPKLDEAIRKAKNPNRNPLEPTGFVSPSRVGPLPVPDPERAGESFQILESDQWSQKDGVIRASGGFHAVYKGYDLFGDELEFNRRTEVATITGNAKIIGLEGVVEGNRIIVNFRARNYRGEDARAVLRPSGTQGRTAENVFVKGGTLTGNEREAKGHDCGFTSCDRTEPHFHFEADKMTVRPGKRAIMRDVKFKLFGRTIIGVPYLSVPLDERNQRYTPEVGQSQEEGYYIKNRIPVGLFRDDRNDVVARIDYMTRLGTGLGGDWRWDMPDRAGELRVYSLTGRDQTAEIVGRHQQRWGRFDMDLGANYQRQNYLNAPQNTTLSNSVRMNYRAGRGSTGLNWNRYQNDGESFSSTTQTVGLTDTREFGPRTRTSLDLILNESRSQFGGGSSERSQLDVRFRGTHDLRRADAELEYFRSIPIGDTLGFFSSAERTPVLTLRSDGSRLFGQEWPRQYPLRAEFAVGEYSNPSNRSRISRGLLDLNLQRPDQDRGRWGLSLDGRYRQGVYDDDTAQYVLGLNGVARYSLRDGGGLNVRYSYLEPTGYTPLDFDRQGRYHLLTGDLSFPTLRNLKLGAQTGYDFLLAEQGETAWQSVGVRTEWTPRRNAQLRTLSTYDPFAQAWTNVRIDGVWRTGSTYLSVGARYDGLRHTWGNLNFYLDGFQWGRLRFSTLLAYNGYLREFEARHFNFIYDLHCAEAILQILDNPLGFRAGRTISFYIRLKAFPFDTGFGLGRRGSSFGTGTGRDGF